MTARYELNFSGYFHELRVRALPDASGIYGVYAGTDGLHGSLSLDRLLYIGEAASVRDRLANHGKWTEWREKLHRYESLLFNVAFISGQNDRRRAEAAMIFANKPPCNTEY
jgi:hypothetical protein